ncbi:MAG TPA: class A beta-lactamase, partial [Pyrinomonadaceae bacterium]|nr:class A beta-lactamase [Pyrinomonadaceae bacterium]
SCGLLHFGFLFTALAWLAGCTYKTDIPLEFPTPPAAAPATPLTKIETRRDVDLEHQLDEIAKEARGKVGVAAVLIETGDAAFLNADGRYPMQSVYKLPIAMAVLEQIRMGDAALDEKIGVTKEDMVRAGMRSPLRDSTPDGGVFTIRELIRLSMVESDGTASDVLMRIAGGAGEIQSFLTKIGITDWKIANSEKEIGRDWQTQYQNWATPMAAVELLRWLHGSGKSDAFKRSSASEEGTPEGVTLTALLIEDMANSNPGPRRLKGLLPKGTVVAHKTGTSGTRDGITAATNDIGIITVAPDKHVAIAVFVSDSAADEKPREAVIAKIAKAAWDRWTSR